MVKRINLQKIGKILKAIEKTKHSSHEVKIREVEKIYSTKKDYTNYIDKKDHYYVGKANFIGANKNKEFNIISLEKEICIENSIVSLREATPIEISKFKNHKEWFNDATEKVYIICPSLDIKESFSLLTEIYKQLIDLFLTENCIKDPSILLVDKSFFIPLFGDEPRLIQPYNGHTIKMTPTGTGKSTIILVMGEEPIKNPTEAGLIGSNNEDYTQQHRGLLEKEGFVALDELNTEDIQVISKILTYMEQGEVKRGLKIGVKCKGTKTIIINGNPGNESETLYTNFRRDIISIAGTESPKRVGRRIGHLLLGKGDDYMRVDNSKEITCYTLILRELFKTAIEENKGKIKKIQSSLRRFASKENKDYSKKIQELANQIPDRIVKEFIEGFAIGSSKRVNMSSVRYSILINLDKIVLGKANKELIQKIKEDAILIRPNLEKINLDSIERLLPPSQKMSRLSKKEQFYLMLKEYDKKSLREYSKMIGVSHQTIRNWLQEKSLQNLQSNLSINKAKKKTSQEGVKIVKCKK